MYLKHSLFTLITGIMLSCFLLPDNSLKAANETSALTPSDITEVKTDRKTHEVDVRETLFSISRQYGVSVQDLRDWNNLTSDALSPGTVLYVEPEPRETTRPQPRPERDQQTTPETPARSTTERTHTVQQGETMFSISRRYEITVQDLAEWNRLESSALRIGQELIVGRSEPAADQPAEQPVTAVQPEDRDRLSLERDGPAYTYYTVRRGDTLSAIARLHGVTVPELRSMNELRSDVLSIGQELIVGREASGSGITGLTVESTAQGRFYTYEVKSSDRIENLLETHEMDETDFRALNPGMRPSDVRSGQQIVLLAPPTVRHANPYRRAASSANGPASDVMSATVYSSSERGQTTTSGELYNPQQLTAAHPTLSLGSVVHVKNPESGKGIFILINDRTTDNRLKLSQRAFSLLQLGESSSPQVVVDAHLDR